MRLKLLINRFSQAPEVDYIEIPVEFVTTFDPTGLQQLQREATKAETSLKKISLSPSERVGSLAKSYKDYFKKTPIQRLTDSSINMKEQVRNYKPASSVKDLFKENQSYQLGGYALPKIMSVKGFSNKDMGGSLSGIFKTDGAADANKEVQSLTSSYKGLNTQLNKTQSSSNKAELSLKGFASMIRSSVLIQVQALAQVLRRAFRFMEESFQAAGDYVESINLYTMSVGDYAEAGKKWAQEISDALYLDTSEIFQYTGQFFNLTRGLGATAEAADLMSRNLTQLSYDMASYLNIDVSVANNKLMSAMSGQTKAVTSVGIAVQSASLQELAYSLNINKSVQEMTQAEKTYLRYIQIMRSTTQMQGDLGRTIITPTNAMRLLKTQLTLLARAIGQVLTPIIMQAIPYIIAFTQVLTELAQSLAKMFGYKLEDYLAPASSVKALSDGFGDLSDSAKEAADNVSRTLAPFDELNVVEMQGKNKGAGGMDDSVLSDLEQYLDGYDMLEFYTQNMKDKIEAIKKKIKELGPVIAAVFGAIALTKFLNKLRQMKDALTVLNPVTKKLSGVFKTLITRFVDGYKYSKFMGEKGFTSILAGTRNMLTPLGKLAVTLTSCIVSFKAGYDSMYQYGNGTKSLNDALAQTVTVTALASAATFALVNPASAVVVLFAGLTGAVIGYGKALNEIEVYNAVFDNQGISIETLSRHYTDMFKESKKYIDNVEEIGQKYTTTKAQMDDTRTSLDNFIESLNLQDEEISSSQLESLQMKYSQLKDETIETQKASDNFFIALIKSSGEAKGKTEADIAAEIANYKALSSTVNDYEQSYIDKEQELTMARYTGKMTAEEYNDAIHKLKVQYGYATDYAYNASGAVENFSSKIKDIDYKNLDTLNDTVKKTHDEYTNTIETLKEYKKNIKATYEESVQPIKDRIEQLETQKRLTGELSSEEQSMLDGLKAKYNEQKTIYKENISEVNNTIKNVQGEYKGFLATVYADLASNGSLTSAQFNKSIGTIKNDLNSIKDVDMSGTGKALFDSMQDSILGSGNSSMITRTRTALKKVGIEGKSELMNYLTVDEANKAGLYKNWSEASAAINDGLADGLDKTQYKPKQSTKQTSLDMISVFKETNKIKSPSKVYRELGQYIPEGVAKGIEDGSSKAIKALTNLTTKMQDSVKNLNLSINTSGFTNSLNALLNKLQTFSNNFTSSVNSLLSNFKRAINDIRVEGNKITFTKMPYISVPRFAEGGYPEKGQMFIANEDGPELIGKIGNKTAVANTDQITTAMTNAMITALGNSNTNKTGKTVIYIGNKKVFDGMGDYVDSENDRYGTNYIRV